jgi:superfamily I DNA/RNA helicase
MAIELSKEIIDYVNSDGRVFLFACPGSGKTTTVAYKLSKLTSSWDSNYPKFAGVACLSFTNIAKEEIFKKYTEFSDSYIKYPHLVSTIDSFINKYITLPFFSLLFPNTARPRIIEDGDIINSAWRRNPEAKKFRNQKNQPLDFSYSPIDIHLEIDGSFTWRGKTPQSVDLNVFYDYAKTVKNWQIKQRGILTINDSSYIALKLLGAVPRIAELIAQRFPIIIVDEAQDTSEIQFEILNLIADAGARSLELIGDPYQGLYEWRDAEPSIFVSRIKNNSKWKVIELNDNRRSQQNIIDCFSLLRQSSEKKIKGIGKFAKESPVFVIKYSAEEIEAVHKFLPLVQDYKENYVLVRGRPLRNKLLGHLEPKNPPWNSGIPTKLIESKKLFEESLNKKGINLFISAIPDIVSPGCSLDKRQELLEGLENDFELRTIIFQTIRSLPSFELTLAEWTKQTELFVLEGLAKRFSNLSPINFGLKKSKEYKEIGIRQMKEIFGVSSKLPLPVTTVHQVKGMTLDSVLLVLNKTSIANNVSFKELSTPQEFPKEKQRIIYVAMSRPRHLLAIGLPDKIIDDEIKRKLGDKIEIIK